MANLRIVSAIATSSSNIEVKFTETLTPSLVASNFSLLSDTINVPDANVLTVTVTGDVVSLTCQPLTELATYFVVCKSTSAHPFRSLNGQSALIEDGISNKYLLTAPLSPDNPVRNFLGAFYHDNIYNITDETTIVSKYIKSLSVTLARALYDIRQVKNENYLSLTIVDEQQIRGEGPVDRLAEEAAYEILRVGRTPTGTAVTNTIVLESAPYYPITLQAKNNIEILHADSSDDAGKFDINNLILNLSSYPVTKVKSITFTFLSSTPVYVYDIEKLGYQIKDSRYDQEFGFTYLSLEDNQIKISDEVLKDPNFDVLNIFKVDVEYESKNLGIVVDPNTINVYKTELAPREVLPPIINVFSLKHAPITDGNNNVPQLGGVLFQDPNQNTPGAKHPAFTHEIIFRLSALPSSPGQYSVDYNTGTVYVYGNDINNDGTGPYPPLATYFYRHVYENEIDYVYDVELLDIVALPFGNLIEEAGSINFGYEEVLVPNVDYVANLHKEELTERSDNRVIALNAIRTINSPITNVFRIFNETSGEIYTIDRWNDNKIYFRYNTPPRILAQVNERVNFAKVTSELLFVSSTLFNSGLRIFKILLDSNSITNATNDGLGTSFNSSLNFSDGNVFKAEKWFDITSNEASNIYRLQNVGEYMVDYINGIVYCAVSNTQQVQIGVATYNTSYIDTNLPHIVSVEDVYYRISPLLPKNKSFSYDSFTDTTILVDELDYSDEAFLNKSLAAPYQLYNGKVGIFQSVFIPGVTHQIKFLRSVFAFDDLLNSSSPINFSTSSISSGFDITVNTLTKKAFDAVKYDVDGYYVNINENIPYLSPDITFTYSIIRTSDSAELWSGSGTVVPGYPVKLILPGINSPQINDYVNITYSFTINPLSRIIVDYNKGDMFVDYTYVGDEIIISYEHGDNVLDFRKGLALSAGDEYYVTYKIGALRDALLKNFGTLVNVEGLDTFEVDLNRERYRDALIAALTSFIQGPTVAAIKNIGKVISHVEPEIIESIFQNWSLGNSLLTPEEIDSKGEFQLIPVKFGPGVLMDRPGQDISLPTNSNLRLEEGTFETWILPQWNGLDNQSRVSITVTKDGYDVEPTSIFIGAGEEHPLTSGTFVLDKQHVSPGPPNTNKDGVFVYYDKDGYGDFSRWYVRVVDGYVVPNVSTYKIKITTDGKFYDMKSITIPKPSNMNTFTGTNSTNITITGGGMIDEGVTFLADLEHYILDVGKEPDKNRLSIYKDVSGYLNFVVLDEDKASYIISADVSSWRASELHHIGASWKLSTRNNRDEMHLFIDGFEVPNIIKYGQKLQPYLHEKFRTVNPEEIIGLTDRDIVGSVDLVTTAGSAVVSSSLNFGTYSIFPGDTIYIDEPGFSTSGYGILSIGGQQLTLDTVMPSTIANGRYSINRTDFTVTSDIDVVPNIAVSTIHPVLDGYDLSIVSSSSVVTSPSVNFTTEEVLPGDMIRINAPGLEVFYNIIQVSGNSLTITDPMPSTLSGLDFFIYKNEEEEIPGVRALRPSYSISKDGYFNNILTISNNVFADDLILIRTLGINNRRIKERYYVWSSGQENVLMTRLPPPISLDEAKITKIILPMTSIGPANSTYGSGVFTSNNLTGSHASNSEIGRTLKVSIGGINADFSTPVTVTINGLSGINIINEVLNFSDYGSQDTTNLFIDVNYVKVVAKPINPTRPAVGVEVKEKYPITYSEQSGLVPVVRYSYQISTGYGLKDDGYGIVRDDNNMFSVLDIDNYLVIHSPMSVAGFYIITGVSDDKKSLTIQSTNQSTQLPLPAFTNGVYQVLNVSAYRSGLQNGFFTLEAGVLPSQAYFMHSGFYELDYASYDRIKLHMGNTRMHFGSDFNGLRQANAAIDQIKIYSTMLTDTRIGETIPRTQRSITKDFNSLKPLRKDSNTLVLAEFDTFPFTNEADFYSNKSAEKHHFQSAVVVNENFGNSIVILDKPIHVSNEGILDTRKNGSIEFWVNHIYDTANDPQNRFYFDAFGAVVEEAVSTTSTSVKIKAPASQILSVKLKNGNRNDDYFLGGKLEIDTQNAIQEVLTSVGMGSVVVTHPILQVVTVKIVGDKTEKDYFDGGTIGTDRKTIFLSQTLPQSSLPLIVTYQSTENKNVHFNTQVIRLNKQLPSHKSTVIVNYIPKGLQGDRISIYKDTFGYINFGISASGTDFLIRAPVRWAQNTWHRVKASYKINSGTNSDEIRLFLDGYEYNNVLYGTGLIFGKSPIVFGSSFPGDGYTITGNIQFKDPINDLYIGSQYTQESPLFALLDNFRISNISRPIYKPFGESIDVNWSANLNTVFPVTKDLYTTYLMEYDALIEKNTDFAILRNRNNGLFDFTVNIFDSFGIVSSSAKVQEILERLIKVLKPANSRVFIQYIR